MSWSVRSQAGRGLWCAAVVGLTAGSWLGLRHLNRHSPAPTSSADANPASSGPRNTLLPKRPLAARTAAEVEKPAAVRQLAQESHAAVARLRQRFPNEPRATHVAVQLCRGLGESDAARKLLDECLRANPQDARALELLGTMELESGDHQRAEATLSAALGQSLNPRVAFQLGTALFHQGKLQDAATILQASVAADATLLANQVLLGQTYLQLKQDEQARQCFLAATRLAPDYANAQFGLATAYDRLNQPQAAARHRARFQELQAKQLQERIDQARNPDDLQETRELVAQAFVEAARLYREAGDVSNAQKLWRRAAELDSKNSDSRVELALALEGQGQTREALDVLLQLQGLRADDATLWLRLGQLHAKLQEFEEAESAFRRCVALAPEQAKAYFSLAQLYVRANRKLGEASTAIEQALKLEPGNAQYQQLQALIRKKA